MEELNYGLVYVVKGRHKGRILYYDDDDTPKTATCYAGHPLDFVGTFGIPKKRLRVTTIDDLLGRSENIGKLLRTIAIDGEWDSANAWQVHSLWSEKSMIINEITDRRLSAEYGKIEKDVTTFLSHSSHDKGEVRMIYDDLLHLGVKVWMDEAQIKVGDSIVEKISEGLKSSKFLLLVLSEHSVKSVWTQREWNSFLAHQLSTTDVRILPILLEDCEIPIILKDIKYADFRESYHDGLKGTVAALSAA